MKFICPFHGKIKERHVAFIDETTKYVCKLCGRSNEREHKVRVSVKEI